MWRDNTKVHMELTASRLPLCKNECMKRDHGQNCISPGEWTPHVQALWAKLPCLTWILQHKVRKFEAELWYTGATQEAE